MKDWITNELYTFIEITYRRKAILILPTIGLILFILLDTWMQHHLVAAANQSSNSIIDLTPFLLRQYERMRRIAFFEIVIIGSFCWAIKEYLKYRKKY